MRGLFLGVSQDVPRTFGVDSVTIRVYSGPSDFCVTHSSPWLGSVQFWKECPVLAHPGLSVGPLHVSRPQGFYIHPPPPNKTDSSSPNRGGGGGGGGFMFGTK